MIFQTDLFSESFKQVTAEPVSCKNCGSTYIVKDGKSRTNNKRVKRFRCRKCNVVFLQNNSDLPGMRYHSSIIAFASDLYTCLGVSYRRLSELLDRHLHIQVSYETIRQWIAKVSNKLLKHSKQAYNSAVWYADETQIKVSKKQYWIWIVFDPENKIVLSWHVSRKRSIHHAKKLLRKALETADTRPREIITDGLQAYIKAVRKVLGSRFTKHTVIEELPENNPIERVMREVKRRYKWFSTFRTQQGAIDFFELFFFVHNHLKLHRTLDYQTPLTKRTFNEVLSSKLS